MDLQKNIQMMERLRAMILKTGKGCYIVSSANINGDETTRIFHGSYLGYPDADVYKAKLITQGYAGVCIHIGAEYMRLLVEQSSTEIFQKFHPNNL